MQSGALEDADLIDLSALVRKLWSGKWLILACITVCGGLGAVYAFNAREWFRAEVVIVQKESSALPAGLAQLGGLASLAGINIGAGAGSADAPVAVLRSKDLAAGFIKDEGLLTVVLSDYWDSSSGRWAKTISGKTPDIRDAVKYFDERVRTVTEDKKAGLVTLTIMWTNPDDAARWANLLVSRVNLRLRQKAEVEAQRNIAFLKKELAATDVPQLQQSLSRSLESEMQRLMLAKGNEDFAFKVIDGATTPKYRARPRRMIAMALAAIFGGAMAGIWILSRRTDK
jgi:uncharacterized protein involved in exopolysaccharide biosynthesis